MALKDNWETGEIYTAAAANTLATQVNANTEVVESFTEVGLALASAEDAAAARSVIDAVAVGELAYSVRDFGAVGDGTTDDQPAFQDAVDALAASDAPTRRLVVPWTADGYKLADSVVVRGCDGLTIEGDNTLIFGTTNGRPCIAYRIADTASDYYVPQPADVQAWYLTGRYRPGDTSITMTGSREPAISGIPSPWGDAAPKPVTGDWILIRTGNFVPGLAGTHPLAEFNYCVDVTGNTITLAYPLKHYYSDMGDGETFGVAVMTDQITTDLTLRGLHLRHTASRGADLRSVIRTKIEDCHFSGAGGPLTRGRFMDLQFTADITPNWESGWRPYILALDTGTSDVTATIKAVSSGAGIIHVHEGVASANLNIDVQCGKTDAGLFNGTGSPEVWSVVSLQAHARDVTVTGTITNSPRGPAVLSNRSAVYHGWGNDDCVVDVTVNGAIAGEAISHNSDFVNDGDNQDVIVAPSIRAGSAKTTSFGFGTGAVATAKVSYPVTLTAISGSEPTETTEDGETVFSCADAATQGVEFVENIPAGGWTHAMITCEIENVDASSAGNVVWHNFARIGVAGRELNFSGTQDQSIVLPMGAEGATTFIRTPVALGSGTRVGFRVRRNGGGASDTLAGAVKIRRAWITYYVSASSTLVTNSASAATASAVTLAKADNGAIHNITGAVTVTVPSAATLGNGFRCIIQADGNPITIDADGVATDLADGEVAMVYTMGDDLRVAVWSMTSVDQPHDLTDGENTFPRRAVEIACSLPNGSLRLTYFTARKTETITELRFNGGVASVGATLARAGVYEEDPDTGDLTLVASTANDTTLWESTGQITKALSASWSKVRGKRYAVGCLSVGTSTAPQIIGRGSVSIGAELSESPRMSALVASQTDLPATVSVGSMGAANLQYYVAMVP